MKVFILLCAIGAALAAEVCPDNSHFESCGSACPLTCENYRDGPDFCPLVCVSGCVCDEGYVKAIGGKCVRPEHCPAVDPAGYSNTPSCPVNSHYESCGTACPLTCDNYNDPPKACVLMCNPGCHCDEGYVKTHDGKCVKPEHCPARDPPACDENSHYLECGTACPLTCDNYLNPPKICPAMCVSGCHCLKGFVKTEDGHCVRPEQCPMHSVKPKEPSCFGEPDTGNCRAYIPMYYYDIKDATCKRFIYGGCDGNGNRYVTEKECLAQCEGVQERSSSTCELPAEPGVCRGFFPRFHYDAALGKCSEFVYGGCGGNENNFETVEECQQTCGQHSAPQMAFDPSECQKTPETGPCHGNFYRYYYDKSNKECKPFIYGGCQGNGNNFESEEECKKSCGVSSAPSACEQEKFKGPCRAWFPRWFFNKESGRCEEFIYGGCQRNENNFMTQEECEAECVA